MDKIVTVADIREGNFEFWYSSIIGAYASSTQLGALPHKVIACTFDSCLLSTKSYSQVAITNSKLKNCTLHDIGSYVLVGGCFINCTSDRPVGMTNADARGSTLHNTEICDDIICSDLRGAVFNECHFSRCKIANSLKGASFIGCTFKEVTIIEEGMTDFEIYDLISKNSDASGLITSLSKVHE